MVKAEVPIYSISVSGKVQGVFFRATAKKIAQELGLKGFAQNQPDGTVYLEVQGPKTKLDRFIDWCHQGSRYSEVHSVKTKPINSFSLPINEGFFIF